MAVTLISTNGLFTRLGKLFKIADRVNTHQDASTTGLYDEIEDAIEQYSYADVKYADALIGSTVQWQTDAANIYTAIARMARETVIGMVDDDTTLNRKTLRNALVELIDQMGTANDVKGNVFSMSIGSFSGTGNGKAIVSLLNGEGKTFQYLHLDNTNLKCTKDAQITGTAGRESFTVRGEAKISDIRHPDWPGGNGQLNSITVSDPAYSQQSGVGRNNLANGSFNTFSTTNTPDNWTIVTGSAGATIFEEGTIVHRGAKSLELLGNGSLLHSLTQEFGTSGQTSVKLRPETRYACSCWMRVDSAASAGSMTITLRDGSAALISTEATLTVAHGAMTDDTWTHQSFTFSTPAVIPDTAKIYVTASVAIASGGRWYIDGLQVFRMAQVTDASSFHIAVVPGATDFVEDDDAKLTLTRSTAGNMQTFLNKFLGLEEMGLQIPYQTDDSETVGDGLIA